MVSLAPFSYESYNSELLKDPSFFTELIMSSQLPVDRPPKQHQYIRTRHTPHGSFTQPPSPTIPSPLSSRSFEYHRRNSVSTKRNIICRQIPEETTPVPALESCHPRPSQDIPPINTPEPYRRLPSATVDRSLRPVGSVQLGLEVALRSKVVNSIGQEIEFGEVLDPKFRTVVIFIRHFRCPYCQQYIKALTELTTREPKLNIFKSRIKIVIVGQGHFQMIGPYRTLFNCPFPMYSDQNRLHPLFSALGMTYKTLSLGPNSTKGSYLRDCSTLDLLIQILKSASRMPLKYSGDLQQLGGEFVFEPVPEHRIRRKPICNDQDTPLHVSHHPPTPSPKLVKPGRAFLQSQILINFANHVNYVDPAASSSASTATAKTSHSISSAVSSASYSVWSEAGSDESPRRRVRFQCRYAHRMRNIRDHASWEDVLIAAGVKII